MRVTRKCPSRYFCRNRFGAAPPGQRREERRWDIARSPRTDTHLLSRQPARAPLRLTSTAGRPRWTERMRAFSSCWGSMPGILVPDSPSGDAFYAPARNQVARRPLHQQAVRRGAPSAINVSVTCWQVTLCRVRILRSSVEAGAAAQKGQNRVRHFGGVFALCVHLLYSVLVCHAACAIAWIRDRDVDA